MKKFMFFLTAAIMAMSLTAAPVDHASAMKKAQSFLTNELYAGKMMSPAATTPVLLKAEMGNVKYNEPVYYIYNTSSTFIVVAGDDRAEEILMVGDRPLSDVNNLPLGLQDMLGQYKDQIMYLQEHPGLHGNLLANWVRYKTYFDFSPWNMWVPYIILVKDSQFAEWQTGLNKVVPLTSLSTSHFKWKDLGTVTLTRTLSGNTYLGTKTVNPKTFHVLLVATHWRHITVRNLDEPTKIIFDFTKDWRQQPDKKLLTREGYNDIQCIWNRMEITSSEFSFTDKGKRNTDYTDIYIQKNDQ